MAARSLGAEVPPGGGEFRVVLAISGAASLGGVAMISPAQRSRVPIGKMRDLKARRAQITGGYQRLGCRRRVSGQCLLVCRFLGRRHDGGAAGRWPTRAPTCWPESGMARRSHCTATTCRLRQTAPSRSGPASAAARPGTGNTSSAAPNMARAARTCRRRARGGIQAAPSRVARSRPRSQAPVTVST